MPRTLHLIALAALFAACSSDSTAPPPPPPALALDTLLLSMPSTTIEVGQLLPVSVQAMRAGEVITTYTYQWESTAPSIASVDSRGRVLGVAPGTTQVRATGGGKSTVIVVTVANRVVTAISIVPSSLALAPGGIGSFAGAAIGINGTPIAGQALAWTSSAPAVATVSSSGVVTAVGTGTAIITASHAGISRSRGVTVSTSPENLRITRVDPIQAIQDPAGTIPLIRTKPSAIRVVAESKIAGRDGVIVRIVLTRAGTTLYQVDATLGVLPLSADPANVAHGLMVPMPAGLDVDGASITVVIDPDGELGESDEFDNTWPIDDAPPLVTRAMTPLRVRFIPIAAAGGTPPLVTADEVQRLADYVAKVYPVSQVIADVGTPLVSSSSWNTDNEVLAALLELESVRVADGFDGHYYGITSGILPTGFSGYGFVPGRVSLGVSNPSTVAHEIGHNHGLSHTPGCGNPGTWPYPNAGIGMPGYDGLTAMPIASNAVDFMSYCNGVRWVSATVYRALYNVRRTGSATMPGMSAVVEPGDAIVVSGIVTDRRTLRVETPRYIVGARGERSVGGDVVIELLDDRGGLIRRAGSDLPELSRENPRSAPLSAFTAVLRITPGERARIASIAVSIPRLSLSATRRVR